jgi:hypothetical protein
VLVVVVVVTMMTTMRRQTFSLIQNARGEYLTKHGQMKI